MSDINITVQDEIVNIDILDEPVLVNVVNSPGVPGAPGQGVPVGGTTGQVLAKNSNTNYDTEWVDVSGGVWGDITGTLSDQTDLQTALDGKFDEPTGDTTQYIAGDGSLVAFPITGQAGTLVREVRNVTGATLLKGTVVYINGASGNKPTVAKAIATSDATSAQTFGLIQADIPNNSNGYLVAFGDLDGLDTSAFADGVQLYLSSTVLGGYTSTKQYAPAHLVYIGVVTRSHPNQGRIEVRIQNGFEMDELHDVAAQTPSSNDGLFYNTTTSLWENKSIATALGYTPANSATTLTINGVTYDLSANRSWTIAAGISGSGASGQVAYWTGTSAQTGDSGLTWDTINKRLVIATSVQSTSIGNFRGANSVGENIWIGGGGIQSVGAVGETYKGSYNTSIGNQALNSNTTGYNNLALGYQALYTNTTGYNDTAFGSYSLYANTIGYQNVAFGMLSLRLNTEGFNNTAIGHEAGRGLGGINGNTTGSNNIFIGFQSVGVSATESNRTWIGNSSTTSTWLAGNLLLGSTTNTGERLQVTGTMKVTGVTTLQSTLRVDGNYIDNRGNFLITQSSSATASNRDLLFGNATYGRCGVAAKNFLFSYNGTLPPLGTYTFYVNGETNTGAGSGTGIYFKATAAQAGSNGSGGDFIIDVANGDGTGRNGRFGIFTTSPTALVDIAASTTSNASLRIRSGTAPTSPNNGDIWFDGTDIKMRIGGVTKTFTLV